MVRVKICGITRPEDAEAAVHLGADAIGFVFWPGSPRRVDPAVAHAIVRALPPFVTVVGVFVDQPVREVADIADAVGVGVLQLHGSEDPAAYLDAGRRLIKAIALEPADPVGLPAVPPQVTVLIDAHDPVRRGGTGRTVDWSLAALVARRRPVVLSGGLTAANVRRAVAEVRPYAVDVSSGVEIAPGVKDRDKLRDFFAALAPREAGRQAGRDGEA